MDDPLLSFARVALGDLAIGVDIRCVVRAVARPSMLTRLPRSHDAVDGVFADGDQAIPVVDLRKWMGEPADAAPAQVLVLGAGGRMIGLAIDAVRGLVRARASQLRRVHHAEVDDDFFHSVVPGGDDGLLSLLDPLCLMQRVQAWTAAGHADAAASAAGPTENAADATPMQALVRLGASLLAVPAVLVAQVMARPAAQPLLGSGQALLGMIEWRSRHVPLLDLARMLELESGNAPLAMVLAQGERLVALPIDEVVAVRQLPAQGVTPARDAGIAHPLVEGVALLDDGERVLLLGAEALLRIHATPGLAQQASGGAGRRGARAPAHVVVDSGRRWAIPMGALEEILPLPAGLDEAANGVGATCNWRGRSLPLVDLREQKDGVSAAGPQRLVVASHAGRHAALWVNDVVELLPAQLGELLQFQLAGGTRVRMITVGLGAAGVSYQVLDLDALFRRLESA